MLETIPWGPLLTGGGFTAIALGSVWMVLTGKLVTAKQHDDMVRAKEHWRAACEREQEANRLHARSSDVRQTVDETVLKLVSAIQEQQSPRGGDDT